MAAIRNWLWAPLVAIALVGTGGASAHLLGSRTPAALADTPACNNVNHNTASGQAWYCGSGDDGKHYDMRCTGNLRQGPGLGYAIHGTATGNGILLYRHVYNGSNVDGGCNGPITTEWFLSSNGWVSRAITYAPY